MPSPRTTTLLSNFHGTHTTGIFSFCLYPRSTRAFSAHHGISRKRPQRPRPRPRPHQTPASRPTIVSFSTTTQPSHEQNYYEVLDLPITATAAEIKKQFYALSLRHHPDRNRADPEASQRFARISSAYNVLGNAQKRSTYDREHGFHHAHQRAPGQHPMGSHSSYSANLHSKGSYAGSRPPSGLSNRRGPFRGPPPSFYAQGGYGRTGRTAEGSHTAGAGDANQAASGGGFASSSSSSSSSSFAGGGAGQTKSGRYDPEDPTGFIDRNPLGHFDARGHFRTQSAEDARRRERRVKARRSAVKEEDISRREGIGVIHFVVVGGMLAFASLTAAFFTPPGTATKPSGAVVSGSSGTGTRTGDGKMGRRRKEESVSAPVT